MHEKIRLGLCPIGKFVFSHEDAKVQKALLEEKLRAMGVDFRGIDGAVPDGVIRGVEHVDAAVAALRAQEVDALFLPHVNFGTESAAGLIARKLGVPVLLWGPRDEAPLPDGTRLRDSLCGMFATSKVLVKLGVPFSHIENCRVDDPAFTEGLDRFLRAANVVRRLRGARIGMVGNRIDFFWSTIVDESDLLRRFGVEVQPMDLARAIRRTRELAASRRDAYLAEIVSLRGRLDLSAMPEQGMVHVLAFRDMLLEFARDERLSAIAVESFMTVIEELGACLSFAQSEVSDRGVPCVCESDLHGAVSAIVAEAAAMGSGPSFFADLTVRHPDDDNGLLLWHDAFPLSLKAPDSPASLGSHWILPDFQPGMCHWRLKDGEVTIVRFDGEAGRYKLLAQECRTIPGPFTQNTYVWVALEDWPRFERKVIRGPYIHHTACVYGRHADALREACRFLDGLEFDGDAD
jgi:L-fucose isomerase-like protein